MMKSRIATSVGAHVMLSATLIPLDVAAQGIVITFDVPGGSQTAATSINPAGAITGSYMDATVGHTHGFLRARDGTITAFDVPGGSGTFPQSINPARAITGSYVDATVGH